MLDNARMSNIDCFTDFPKEPIPSTPNSNERFTYQRNFLYALRFLKVKGCVKDLLFSLKENGLLRYRGHRAGKQHPRSVLSSKHTNHPNVSDFASDTIYPIQVLTGRRYASCSKTRKSVSVSSNLRKLRHEDAPNVMSDDYLINNNPELHPTLFLLNASSLGKPHAIDQLCADLISFQPGLAIIVESWLKKHHSDAGFSVPGYRLYRKDRQGRRGGGIAIYCRNDIQASTFIPSTPDRPEFEVLWLRVNYNKKQYIFGGLYHPPKPIYKTDDFLQYISKTMDEIFVLPGKPHIVLAGDFNLIPMNTIPAMGLQETFVGPTHMGHALDRIYSSVPLYKYCSAVISTIKTKHSAVLATTFKTSPTNTKKENQTKFFRLRTPSANANLHAFISSIEWDLIQLQTSIVDKFDFFYNNIYEAINKCIPLKSVSMGNRSPKYITPYIKYLIRRRNSLLHRHKDEAAEALAKRIGANIAKNNSTSFQGLERGTKALWNEVHRLDGREKGFDTLVGGVTCFTLNEFYQSVSTDLNYIEPSLKKTVGPEFLVGISESEIFKCLTKVRGTQEGPDGIPPWLLSSMAHLLTPPITYLFNCSILHSYIPPQWLISFITPVPKKSFPKQEADFRPISITPVLCRILEKFVVRRYFYPFLTDPKINTPFQDQFAFRPTGSTTAALIALIQRLSDMLNEEPYVRLISLDFSRAFDTVSHSYLAKVLAQLPIPDFIYNWIMALLRNRQHSTKFQGLLSDLKKITASIIQGSGMGPTNFISVISKLKTQDQRNSLLKYADDCYLLIPASNISTTAMELAGVEAWALSCNLKLNTNKSKELIITLPRFKMSNFPSEYPGIERVHNTLILGVQITDKLGFELHVNHICTRALQSIFAIRILIAHGLTGQRLHDVVRSTTLARLSYASPAWYGFTNAEQRGRLNAVIRKLTRLQYLPVDQPSFDELVLHIDRNLFMSVLKNEGHVLHHLLPPVKITKYALRPQLHNRQLPFADNFNRRGFILRMLYF